MKALKSLMAIALTALSANAIANDDCNVLIRATEGKELSLKTYQIEVKKDGVTVLNEKKNTVNTDSLECSKQHTIYIRLMDGNKVLKTRTRTFFVIKLNRIYIDMGE